MGWGGVDFCQVGCSSGISHVGQARWGESGGVARVGWRNQEGCWVGWTSGVAKIGWTKAGGRARRGATSGVSRWDGKPWGVAFMLKNPPEHAAAVTT